MRIEIKNNKDLKREIKTWYNSRADFMKAFREKQGVIDKSKLSKHITGSLGITVGWLNAYNIFFNNIKMDAFFTEMDERYKNT